MTITMEETILRLGVAALFGMMLGMEREAKERPAGFRTFMLISLGAAGFSLVVLNIVENMHDAGDALALDPTRIVEGIVTGIGFLGAGAIIQSRGQVQGVTTGAGVWAAGAIGVACGFGFIQLGGILTLLTLFILLVLGQAEKKWRERRKRDRSVKPET